MKEIFLALALLISTICYSQKGGLNYPVLTLEQAILQGYQLVNNADSLRKYAAISKSKIFITGSFNIASRCTVSGNDVVIEGDKKSLITSTYWETPFRVTETLFITGSNVTLRGLRIKGDSNNILTLDHNYYQQGIRVYAENTSIINCDITNFDFAAVFCSRFNGVRIEQCYLARCKRNGYGYGVWFEGKVGHTAIVKDCIFEDNRESIDAGGQLTVWTAYGNVADKGFTSHRNGIKRAGIGTTVINNYFYNDAGCSFPYPSADTGWLVIQNNYTFLDQASGFTVRDSVNLKAKVLIEDNHYLGEGMNLPQCTLRIDSVIGSRVYFTALSQYKLYELKYGDGSDPIFVRSKSMVKSYAPGTYYLGLRAFDNRGIPSEWKYAKVVVGKSLGFAIKTSSRFTPGPGYYQVQMLIDDSVYWFSDVTKCWTWKRTYLTTPPAGMHKITFRVICLQDCPYAVQIWLDDFDYNGTVLNPGFEDHDDAYDPPYSYWRYRMVGNISIGSGIANTDRCGGQYSWRFEFRPGVGVSVSSGSYADLYQSVLIN